MRHTRGPPGGALVEAGNNRRPPSGSEHLVNTMLEVRIQTNGGLTVSEQVTRNENSAETNQWGSTKDALDG